MDDSTRQEMIDRAYALAYEYEGTYGCCPQCVLAAIDGVFGGVGDEVFKASYGLAGGGGLSTQGTCGALAGGMLALGTRYGREREAFANGSRMNAFKIANELLDRFVAEFGSPLCGGVQARIMGRSFDMWDKKDYAVFEEAGGHADKCTNVAGKAAMFTAQLLLETQEKEQKRAAR